MDLWAIITGLMTLIGFFLQMRGIFPKYKKQIYGGTLIVFGACLGFLMSAATQITLPISKNLNLHNLIGLSLIGGSGLTVIACFAASLLLPEAERRTSASRLGSAVSGFLIFVMVFFYTNFFKPNEVHRLTLTYDEQINCALRAAEKEDFERAIEILESTKLDLKTFDNRLAKLDELIVRTKQRQSDVLQNALKPPQ